jgi:hypothetical protein
MNFFFGYIWFRISKVYRKEDKIGITGSGFLAFVQSVVIMFIVMSIIKSTIGQDYLSLHGRELGYACVVVILVMIAVNHKLYSSRYDFFDELYKMESKAKSIIKGFLVILFLLAPIIYGAFVF